MREYRGKTKEGKWVYGWYSYDQYMEKDSKGKCLGHSIMTYNKDGGEDFEVIPSSVGQATGLKDKGGKMVFEGDIIETVFMKHYEVYYKDGTFKVHTHNLKEALLIYAPKIVGSKTDNPELGGGRSEDT